MSGRTMWPKLWNLKFALQRLAKPSKISFIFHQMTLWTGKVIGNVELCLFLSFPNCSFFMEYKFYLLTFSAWYFYNLFMAHSLGLDITKLNWLFKIVYSQMCWQCSISQWPQEWLSEIIWIQDLPNCAVFNVPLHFRHLVLISVKHFLVR